MVIEHYKKVFKDKKEYICMHEEKIENMTEFITNYLPYYFNGYESFKDYKLSDIDNLMMALPKIIFKENIEDSRRNFGLIGEMIQSASVKYNNEFAQAALKLIVNNPFDDGGEVKGFDNVLLLNNSKEKYLIFGDAKFTKSYIHILDDIKDHMSEEYLNAQAKALIRMLQTPASLIRLDSVVRTDMVKVRDKRDDLTIKNYIEGFCNLGYEIIFHFLTTFNKSEKYKEKKVKSIIDAAEASLITNNISGKVLVSALDLQKLDVIECRKGVSDELTKEIKKQSGN